MTLYWIATIIVGFALVFAITLLAMKIVEARNGMVMSDTAPAAFVFSLIISAVLGLMVFCVSRDSAPSTQPITRTTELNIAEIKHWYGNGIMISEEGQEEPSIFYCPQHLYPRIKHFRGPTIINHQNKQILSIYQDDRS